MDFFLKFTLISYAAVAFFAIGFGLSFATKRTLNMVKLAVIFIVMAVSLSLSFKSETLQNRLIISFVWTSVMGTGFRFGRKMTKRNAHLSGKVSE